jgi:hypothetical protein
LIIKILADWIPPLAVNLVRAAQTSCSTGFLINKIVCDERLLQGHLLAREDVPAETKVQITLTKMKNSEVCAKATSKV